MKKIISHYYLIIAILLVVAYQYFSGLVLHSEFAAGLSDFEYYLSSMILHFLVVLLALIVMVWSGKWQKINSRKFKGSYLFLFLFSSSCFCYLEFRHILSFPSYQK